MPTDSRGDDFRECLTETFPLDDVIERFHQIGVRWGVGLRQMEHAFGEKISESSKLELGNARICGAVWKSTEYLFRIYKLKKEWKDSFLPEYEQWKNEHLKNLETILPYLEKDPRQGFHLEGDFHSFSAERIRQILWSAQIKEER
ncbi:hypothetical protein SDC9_170642 [bioreactor metagenome]|uniref:Uncharacterized protein n=1 Tax=bioreactor metagenome TaxID=1076179 RepID=A0A645GH95_9ZZZZ